MITKKNYAKYVFIALLLILCYIAFLIVKPFFSSVMTACVLTYIFYPIYLRILKWTKGKERLSSALVLVIIVLIVIIPLFLSIGSLAQKLAGDLRYVGNFLSDEGENGEIIQRINDITGFTIHPQDFTNIVSQKVVEFANDFLTSVPQKALAVFIILFLTYYLLMLGPILVQKIYDNIPFKKEVKVEILKDFKDVTYAVIFGNIITALAQGLTGYVGYMIFGVKGAIFFACLTAFFSLFPVVGTTIVWVPSALSLFVDGKIPNGIGMLIYGAFIISMVDNFIKPKIIGDRANIHPALVLLGVVGGISVFGFIGLFIGPMVFALLISFIRVYHIQDPMWKKKKNYSILDKPITSETKKVRFYLFFNRE